MDQKTFWEINWSKETIRLPVNSFARKAYELIGSKRRTLLNLGCGNGADSLYFAKKGLMVTAVDWSSNALHQLGETIKRHGIKNVKVVQQDIAKMSLKSNSFDIVYAHLSLHYFDDKTTRKIFDYIHEVLEPDGLFFVKCKSVWDKFYGLGRKIDEDVYEYHGHLRHFFSKDYMIDLLKKFQVIKVRRTSSFYYDYRHFFIEAIAKK